MKHTNNNIKLIKEHDKKSHKGFDSNSVEATEE